MLTSRIDTEPQRLDYLDSVRGIAAIPLSLSSTPSFFSTNFLCTVSSSESSVPDTSKASLLSMTNLCLQANMYEDIESQINKKYSVFSL